MNQDSKPQEGTIQPTESSESSQEDIAEVFQNLTINPSVDLQKFCFDPDMVNTNYLDLLDRCEEKFRKLTVSTNIKMSLWL